MYTLSLESIFMPFLAENITWGKKTKALPCTVLQMMEKVYRPPDPKLLNRRLIS